MKVQLEGWKSSFRLALGLLALALVDFLVHGPHAAQGGGASGGGGGGNSAYNWLHQGALVRCEQ